MWNHLTSTDAHKKHFWPLRMKITLSGTELNHNSPSLNEAKLNYHVLPVRYQGLDQPANVQTNRSGASERSTQVSETGRC